MNQSRFRKTIRSHVSLRSLLFAFGLTLLVTTTASAVEQPMGWDLLPEILSRIVPPTFPDRDFVVTEYGVAELRGRSIAERARALIEIAHPDFRDELRHEAGSLGFL